MDTKINQIPPEFIDEITGEIIYPESDGEPMAENTTHFQKITTIQGGLDSLFASRTDVFVAGDLYWYPEEGKPHIRVALDIMVAFGRPKGHRSSYEQWNEDHIAPQVVMEILSPGNTVTEMLDKFIFYQKYQVQEYYVYDYRKNRFFAWKREGERLDNVLIEPDYISPLLGVRFEIREDDLYIFNPDGTPFLTYVQIDAARKEALALAEEERKTKEEALALAEEERKTKEEALREENKALEELTKLKNLLKSKGYQIDL
ncbi:MAG: Uma2 family endonuclease [Microscillaceae bacterium]|nr:Uma2 family endonuclease [Microscillaceae bacterium]